MTAKFTINHAMREQVANKLVIQAVAQHGPRLGRALSDFNDAFWKRHVEHAKALPGLNPNNWHYLIQRGAVAATSSGYPLYQEEAESMPCELIRFSYMGERERLCTANILGSPAFASVARYIVNATEYGRDRDVFRLKLQCPFGAVPRWKNFEFIIDSELVQSALDIKRDLHGVLNAGYQFRNQAMDLLMACRTSSQVEDLFPEAVKLLPQPAKKGTEVVPVELAQSVRDMLKQGVPPVASH